MKALLLLAVVASLALADPQTWDLHVLNDYLSRGAACLDGSAPAYYLRPGYGDGATKYIIHQEGGAWCYNLDDCLSRSKTRLGSSKGYPATLQWEDYFFKSELPENPLASWNWIYMKYCDGASFSGARDEPTVYKGTKLFFRGKANFEAVMDDLLVRRGLDNATDVILSGCSAGGLATYMHADRFSAWMQQVNPRARVVALADSGFFPDYEGDLHFHSHQQWVFSYHNASWGVNDRCVAAHPNDPWSCFFAEHVVEHIRSPIMAMQSSYDGWDVPNVLGSTDPAAINQWGAVRNDKLLAFVKSDPRRALYLDSCSHHCFFDSGHGDTIRIEGTTMMGAVAEWLAGSGPSMLWFGDETYPCTECCGTTTGSTA